jgi:DNA-binding PadR family transcriptional regulator
LETQFPGHNLSELEGAVLGVIWTGGPLTAYAIRSTFSKSRCSHFSRSAGAIYPLVDRLMDAGLVQAARHKQGNRVSRRITITTAGRGAFCQWLARDKANMAAVEFDPIRARVHFLGVLTSPQRRTFLDDGIVSLQREIAATELLIEHRRKTDDRWSVWGAAGALRILQSRLAWPKDILESEQSSHND